MLDETPPKVVRLNLQLATTVKERLERLRDETQAPSMSETVRRALDVYGQLVDAADGKPFVELLIDGKPTIVFF